MNHRLKKERQNALDYKIVEQVLRQYCFNRLYLRFSGGGLGAIQLDPQASRKINAHKAVEFCTDVRRACVQALTARIEQDCLDGMLHEMVNGTINHSLSLGLRATVTEKLARYFRAGHLTVNKYFKTYKR
jgi:hypothetical protein